MKFKVRTPLPILFALSASLAMPLAIAQATTPPPQEPPASTSGDASLTAQPPTGSVAPSFADFDVDSDGKISKAEAAIDSQLTREFASRDKDRDGVLSPTEYNAAHNKHDDGKRK